MDDFHPIYYRILQFRLLDSKAEIVLDKGVPELSWILLNLLWNLRRLLLEHILLFDIVLSVQAIQFFLRSPFIWVILKVDLKQVLQLRIFAG
jgi:hypothetical protein